MEDILRKIYRNDYDESLSYAEQIRLPIFHCQIRVYKSATYAGILKDALDYILKNLHLDITNETSSGLIGVLNLYDIVIDHVDENTYRELKYLRENISSHRELIGEIDEYMKWFEKLNDMVIESYNIAKTDSVLIEDYIEYFDTIHNRYNNGKSRSRDCKIIQYAKILFEGTFMLQPKWSLIEYWSIITTSNCILDRLLDI